MSRIVLASRDDGFGGRPTGSVWGPHNGQVRRWKQPLDEIEPAHALVELSRGAPDVVAFGADVPLPTALHLARMLDDEHPEVSVVLVTDPTPRLWEQALRAGVDAVVPVDADEHEITTQIERALEAANRRRRNLVGEADPSRSSRRVISVVSPKGGTGRSVVAVNLASALAAAAPGEVVIVDLDLQFGDVASGLQLIPEHTIADAANTGELDLTSLKVFLTPHPDQLYALCAPESPAEADDVRSELVSSVLELLSAEFRYVVVDTASGIDEHALAAMEASTDLVLVGNMDVPSVRSMRKAVQVFDQLGLVRPTRHFVLNRSDSRVGLSAADIEQTVGLRIDGGIPSARAVTVSFNEGLPIVRSDPRSGAARCFVELAERFTDVPAELPAPRRGGLFSRRRGG